MTYPGHVSIAVQAQDPELDERAHILARELGLPFCRSSQQDPPFELILSLDTYMLELRQSGADAPGPVFVDFVGGALLHRRLFGGGRNQPLGRAVGIKGSDQPTVLDATAGLGRDSFVFACLGCKVTLVERSAVISALLRDGLMRALQDPDTAEIVTQRMHLVHEDAMVYMDSLEGEQRPEVIYLDPMYPHREKSALVKKEMRLLQQLLGPDQDSTQLLQAALKCAQKRVVVKRPRTATRLDGPEPTMSIYGKNTRYDVYVMAAMNPAPQTPE